MGYPRGELGLGYTRVWHDGPVDVYTLWIRPDVFEAGPGGRSSPGVPVRSSLQ